VTEVNERSRQVAALFDQLAPTYEAVGIPWFTPIAERLVDEMDPHIGAKVLDIGCGRGVAIPKLSAAVGRSGRVVGIDVSQKMLDRARQSVSLRDLRNVDLYVMDAMAPALPKSSFNYAIASLVASFLPDLPRALKVWHDLLVPTGKLGLSTFAERDPEWEEVQELFNPYLPPEMLDARMTGDHGPFASDAGVAKLVADAGFERVHTVRWNLPVTFESPAQWRTWSMSHGPRAMWHAVPEGAREEVQRRAAAILERRNGPGNNITLTQTIRITLASRKLVG
jgi:ubiquinone/menaquinone biosynthesis C-methylase UbiE